MINSKSCKKTKHMAGVSQLNQFPCKTLSATPPRHHSKTSLPLTSVGVASSLVDGPKLSTREFNRAKPVFRLRAITDDDEWGPEKEGPEGEVSAVAVAEEKVEPEEITMLKKVLVNSFYGTDRGLRATSETRAEIVELITQLEAQNPNPAPTEALTLLNGKWILA